MGNLSASSASKSHHTQAQKVAAVEYHAASHTTLAQTCRTLGYLPRYVLKRWILKIHPESLKKQETLLRTASI